jgi:hypothetical protein
VCVLRCLTQKGPTSNRGSLGLPGPTTVGVRKFGLHGKIGNVEGGRVASGQRRGSVLHCCAFTSAVAVVLMRVFVIY